MAIKRSGERPSKGRPVSYHESITYGNAAASGEPTATTTTTTTMTMPAQSAPVSPSTPLPLRRRPTASYTPPLLPSSPLLAAPTQHKKKSQALASIMESRQPPKPKKYQPLQSISMERRAKASTLAIGDTPRRPQNLSLEDRFGAASRMSNSDYERYREWVDNVSDSPEQLVDKLEQNAKDNKERMKKLSDSISILTSGMKEFRSVKEDWDGMVDMSTKMVKRKRSETKEAYDRINDLNHQIGRELTKNFPYIPYEMLVDHQYACSFPQTKLNQKKQ